jgi:hypothetical protein
MNAIKTARKRLKADPTSDSSKTIASLVLALESESDSIFKVSSLYELDLKDFELAIEILHDWRLERYYAKKSRLYDLSREVHGLEPISPMGDTPVGGSDA